MIPPRIIEIAAEAHERTGRPLPRDPLGILRAMVEISATPEYAAWHAEHEAALAAQAAERRRIEVERRRAQWSGHTLGTFDPSRGQHARKALASVLGWVERYTTEARPEHPWLLLRGPIGTGKTHLGMGAAAELHARGCDVVSISGRGLQIETRPEGRWERYGELGRVDLLVIDDAGRWDVTPYLRGVVETVITARYDRRLPTVITTNAVDSQRIFEGFAEGVDYLADRVRELSHVVTTGPAVGGRWAGESQRGR